MKKIIAFLLVLAVTAGTFAAQPVQAAAESPAAVSPQGFLAEDGTLNLNSGFNGALDLEGWDVTLDPVKGPVFAPVASQGNWEGVTAEGGAFNSSPISFLVDGTNVYAGGYFGNVGSNTEADGIAMWNGAVWQPLGSDGSGDSALQGWVNDMVKIGSDLYVAGSFSLKDTSGNLIPNSNNLAIWDGNANEWVAMPNLTTPLNSQVVDLAYDSTNNVLYAGGYFTNANGIAEADRVVMYDIYNKSWHALGSDGAGDGSLKTNGVWALEVDSQGNLYAGGGFMNVNNGSNVLDEADFIAMWDGSDWHSLGAVALNQAVETIAIDASDNVYVGGYFENAGGVAAADLIAKWDGVNWSALGDNGAGDGALEKDANNNYVYTIAVDGTDVYVGGNFQNAGGAPEADFVAMWDGSAWSGLGSNGNNDGSLNNEIYELAVANGNVYIGGEFYDVNNNGTKLKQADFFAIWDGANWSTLGDPEGGVGQIVEAVASIGTDVYVGGWFFNLGGNNKIDYLARWDGSDWHPVGNEGYTQSALNNRVFSLAVVGTDLHVGGIFTDVRDNGAPITAADRIARWDGSNWHSLGASEAITNGGVSVITPRGTDLYIGGGFTDAAGNPAADYIVKWDGTNWHALGSNGAGDGALKTDTGRSVNAIAVHGTQVFAGGYFDNVRDTTNTPITNTARLALWDGSAWSALPGTTTPFVGTIHALAYANDTLYIGGIFSNANGIPAADHIATWDSATATWGSLGSNGSNDGSLNNPVFAILIQGNTVYAGGQFTDINNNGTPLPEADYIASFDGANWSALGSNGSSDGSLNSYVISLTAIQDDLWVGGDFTNVNNNGTILTTADYVAAYGLPPVPPSVVSITRASASPTAATSVNFHVSFSEEVTGVDANDFELAFSGVTSPAITNVSGTGNFYTVSVQTGSGTSGSIRLDVKSDATIEDTSSYALTNIPYVSGEEYVIQKSATFKSGGTPDGWILESTEISGVGGTLNKGGKTLLIGDDAQNRQYRAILSFGTATLPDNATLTKVTLKVRRQGVTGGGNPITTFGGFFVDIKKGNFGTAALQAADFQTTGNKTYGAFKPKLVSGWYSINLTAGKNFINKMGNTQIRLRFKTDDNNDFIANFLSLHSGNAASASRPQLIVEFSTP